MSFQSWWQRKSRRAKAITLLATLLTLQVGLCFGTPAGVSWSDQTLGTHLGRGELAALGYMVAEALAAGVVFLVFLGFLIFYRPSVSSPAAAGPINDQEKADDDRGQI